MQPGRRGQVTNLQHTVVAHAFRKLLFWLHLLTGVSVGAVVLLMSVTGVLLTYQRQFTAWADTRGLDGAAPHAEARPLPVDALLARVGQRHQGRPTAVTWRNDPDAPVAVAFGRERTLFVNAYTGAVLGEGSPAVRRVFRVVTEWHRYLGRSGDGRPLGKSITGAANLGFLFLVLSGAYLWLPRRWSRPAVRNVALFRGGLSGKARDFNWHNVIGVWSVLPLVLIVASGTMISYPWATALVYRMVGDTPPAPARPTPAAIERPAPRAAPGATEPARGADALAAPAPLAALPPLPPLEPLVAVARQRLPEWKTIALQLPQRDSAGARAVFTLDQGTGGQPQARAQLTLDRATGAEVRWEPFSAGSPGRRLRSILRFAHTGEVLGLAGQTIAGLLSLGAALLVWTGLSLAWRRLRAWLGRRAVVERA